jgi:hypothetical protein
MGFNEETALSGKVTQFETIVVKFLPLKEYDLSIPRSFVMPEAVLYSRYFDNRSQQRG